MNQENALGAPTEGLGQNVTFAVRGAGSSTLDALGAAPVRNDAQGGQGGGVIAPMAVPKEAPNPTMLLLSKAGDKLLGDSINARRKEKFVEGMQQARAGVALMDIAESVPWYSKLFGDTDVISGARAYTQQTKAQEAVLAMREQMPELRKLPLDQARGVFTKNIDAAMTGDAETDALLMQSFARVMPGIMAEQTREHYKYAQESAVAAHGKALASGATLLQGVANEHVTNDTDPAELDSARGAYLGLLAKPNGMDDDAYNKALSTHIVAAAENGDFHAINVIREAKVLDVLPEELRAKVIRNIDINERNLPKGPAGEKYADRLLNLQRMAREIDLTAGPLPDSNVLLAEYAKLNEDWQRETGSALPLVGKTERAREALTLTQRVEQELAADHRERLRLIRESKAEARQAARDNRIARALELNIEAKEATTKGIETAWELNTPHNLLGYKEEAVTAVIADRVSPYLQTAGPLDAAGVRTFQRLGNFIEQGKGDQWLRGKFTTRFNAALNEGMGENFANVYTQYQRIKSVAPLSLGHAFSEKQLKVLDRFSDLTGDRPLQRTAAEVSAFAIATSDTIGGAKVVTSEKVLTQSVLAVAEEHSDMRPGWMLGKKMNTVQATKLAKRINAPVDAFVSSGLSVTDASGRAMGNWKANGGRAPGGIVFEDRSTVGLDDQALFRAGDDTLLFPADPESIGEGFKAFIKDRAKLADIVNVDEVNVTATQPGKALTFVGANAEGTTRMFTASYHDVGKFMHGLHAESVRKRLTLGGNYYTPESYAAGVKELGKQIKEGN